MKFRISNEITEIIWMDPKSSDQCCDEGQESKCRDGSHGRTRQTGSNDSRSWKRQDGASPGAAEESAQPPDTFTSNCWSPDP